MSNNPSTQKISFLSRPIHPKSYFMKNYIAYTILIIASFILTGALFISQISIYSRDEQVTELVNTTTRIKDFTEAMTASGVGDDPELQSIFNLSVVQIAFDSDATVVLTDTLGNVVYYYNPLDPLYEEEDDIPVEIVNATLKNGSYSEIGNLSGFFSETNYIQSQIIQNEQGDNIGVVVLSTPAASISSLIIDLSQMFFLILGIVLVVILILSYFITSKITSPLNEISNASSNFAKGDFSIRVPTGNDCIEIDNLSQSINNMAMSLELSEKSRNQFIENVSHELKTPMTSIGGFVDGILDGTIPHSKQDYYLKIISGEVKRLSRLTTRMLHTAKIQSQDFIITKANFNFVECVSLMIISFETKIIEKNLNIDISMPENLMVFADRDNIYQVIYNLADNAIKFSNDGDSLKIRAYAQNESAIFEISNKTVDISEEKLVHVFDRFYKVDESRSQDISGAGLGLYIVKKIINLHDSDITVNINHGYVTFSFALPLSEI